MDISEFTKASAKYLKAKDVINAKMPMFVITSEAKLVDKNWDNKPSKAVEVEGEMEKVAYKFDLGKLNSRAISEKLGTDTRSWVGHMLVLETYKSKNDKNVLVDCISIKEVK